MPPSSSTAQSSRDAVNNPIRASEVYYTNHDIEILHQIVIAAEELLPTLPERERLPTGALFTAYDEILPSIGVDADHDSRYARLLFKIGGLRGTGSLYEKFRDVLARMNIELELDQTQPQYPDSTVAESQPDHEVATLDGSPRVSVNDRPKYRGRRNSESSVWDLTHQLSATPGRQRRSFSSIGNTNPGSRQRSPARSIEPLRALHRQDAEDAKRTVGDWLRSGRNQSPRRTRSTSTNNHIPQRPASWMNRDQGTATSRSNAASDDYQGASEEDTIPTSSLDQRSALGIDNQLPRNQNMGRDGDAMLEVKASLIRNRRLGMKVQYQLQVWKDKAMQQRENNFNLDRIAMHQDKKVLLGSALDGWRQHLRARRRIAETERFFTQLEKRAERARDLFLLHKSFTHWAQTTIDEVERTSLARRHIVRTRIFNAWRETTVANQLKVRKNILKRFFSLWKRQYAAVTTKQNDAVQRYEHKLVEKIYWDWFFKFCDNNATVWHGQRVKQQLLSVWSVKTRTLRDKQQLAEQTKNLKVAQTSLQTWRIRVDDHAHRVQQAELHYRTHTGRAILGKWRKERRVIPAKVTVQNDVDLRLLRDKFRLWLLRSRQEKQAAQVDRSKILREGWINWRHKLRSQVVQTRVNDRVILQVLYKWVLAERLVLIKRVAEERLLRKSLQNLVQGWRTAREKRWAQEDGAEAFAIRKAQTRVLQCWQERTQNRKALEAAALNFRSPRLLHGPFSQWTTQSQHYMKLDKWATDARFYFLASGSLKIWKASTEASKREKRRHAYAQVRRRTKINMANRFLQNWRQKTQHTIDLDTQADQVATNRTVILGMNVFDRWRARAEELAELETMQREHVIRKFFTIWRDRSTAFEDMQAEAVNHFQERQQDRALKKWTLQVYHVKAQSKYAIEVIQEKNARKHFRRIFAYWQQRTAQKRPMKLGETARAEAWSDFGDELDVDVWPNALEANSFSTPIPGYLSTPSKRTGRVIAAAVRFSSTTPRAPLSTPFERQLRAQYSGNALPSSRRRTGRSNLSFGGGGFADIPDTNQDDQT